MAKMPSAKASVTSINFDSAVKVTSIGSGVAPTPQQKL